MEQAECAAPSGPDAVARLEADERPIAPSRRENGGAGGPFDRVQPDDLFVEPHRAFEVAHQQTYGTRVCRCRKTRRRRRPEPRRCCAGPARLVRLSSTPARRGAGRAPYPCRVAAEDPMSAPRPTVLAAGATGSIGHPVVGEAVSKGHAVRALVCDPFDALDGVRDLGRK